MKILPLKGFKAIKALNAFHTLLLGLKMLPAYIAESYVDFYGAFETKTEQEKERLLREAVLFVQLTEDEVCALVCFATDKNDVPYSEVNIKNLTIDELFEIIVSVCLEIGRIKINILTEAKKKN